MTTRRRPPGRGSAAIRAPRASPAPAIPRCRSARRSGRRADPAPRSRRSTIAAISPTTTKPRSVRRNTSRSGSSKKIRANAVSTAREQLADRPDDADRRRRPTSGPRPSAHRHRPSCGSARPAAGAPSISALTTRSWIVGIAGGEPASQRRAPAASSGSRRTAPRTRARWRAGRRPRGRRCRGPRGTRRRAAAPGREPGTPRTSIAWPGSAAQVLEQDGLEILGADPARGGDQGPDLAAADEPPAAELDALQASRRGPSRRSWRA